MSILKALEASVNRRQFIKGAAAGGAAFIISRLFGCKARPKPHFVSCKLNPSVGNPGDTLYLFIRGEGVHLADKPLTLKLGKDITVSSSNLTKNPSGLKAEIKISENAAPGERAIELWQGDTRVKVLGDNVFTVAEKIKAPEPRHEPYRPSYTPEPEPSYDTEPSAPRKSRRRRRRRRPREQMKPVMEAPMKPRAPRKPPKKFNPFG